MYFNSCEENLLGFYSLGQTLPDQLQHDAKLYKRYFSKMLSLVPDTDKKGFSLTEKVNNLI